METREDDSLVQWVVNWRMLVGAAVLFPLIVPVVLNVLAHRAWTRFDWEWLALSGGTLALVGGGCGLAIGALNRWLAGGGEKSGLCGDVPDNRYGPGVIVSLGWYALCAGAAYLAYLVPDVVAAVFAKVPEEVDALFLAKFDRAKWVCASGVVMMVTGAVMGIVWRGGRRR